ncbi:MAG: putative peptidoglycan glycosyltransferase FtsW [Bacillota bacterium]|nr:putative peptidoglycan glycosyltransferase FtsW [Bacillota bacterium]
MKKYKVTVNKNEIKKYRRVFHQMDYTLVITALILSLLGIVLAFSASYYYSISKFGNPYHLLIDNITWYLISWGVMIFLANFDYHALRHFAVLAIGVGLVLLTMLIVLRGTPLVKTINNASRWLNFGISVMPGELIKPALILFFASWFSAQPNAMKDTKSVLMCFGLLGVIFLLIYKQPNLSTAVIVVSIGAVLMLLAGLSKWFLVGGVGAAFLGSFYLAFIDKGYMHTRFMTAFDPWADALGDGYQVVQGLLAFGSGGMFGKGLGQSIQKTLYLPEPQSDFILPIIGEEIGLVGILGILILYAILIGRIMSIALRAKDTFGCYLAAGTGAMLAINIILNILVVTASFPPTGVFLPFMSQGGNATLVIMALLGIVLNVSRQAKQPEEDE